MKPSIARHLIFLLLRRPHHGSLELVEGEQTHRFGTAGEGDPVVRVVVHDARVYRALLRASLGLGEAYANGWFDCSDLPELARLAALNMPASSQAPRPPSTGLPATPQPARGSRSPRTTTSATTSSA